MKERIGVDSYILDRRDLMWFNKEGVCMEIKENRVWVYEIEKIKSYRLYTVFYDNFGRTSQNEDLQNTQTGNLEHSTWTEKERKLKEGMTARYGEGCKDKIRICKELCKKTELILYLC